MKELAQETAKATEDIAKRVLAIQGDTTAAVAAIEEISSIVAQISDRQTTIASAVEEQTATTSEMSRSVQEAAGGTGEIALNITGVSTRGRLHDPGPDPDADRGGRAVPDGVGPAHQRREVHLLSQATPGRGGEQRSGSPPLRHFCPTLVIKSTMAGRSPDAIAAWSHDAALRCAFGDKVSLYVSPMQRL